MINRINEIFLVAVIIISAILILPTAFASTDVLDNAQDCYDAGYEDGEDFPFDGGANDFCRQFTDDRGNPYYTGFIDGCMSVEGNTIDVCESATD